MFYSRCPGCQHRLKHASEQQGQQIPCPECGITLVVTMSGTEPLEPLPPRKPVTRPYTPGQRAKAPKGGGSGKSGRLLLVVAVAVVGLPVLGCVGCIGLSMLTTPSQSVVKGPSGFPPSKPPEPSEPAEMPKKDADEEQQLAAARLKHVQDVQQKEQMLLAASAQRVKEPGKSLVNLRRRSDRLAFSPDASLIAFSVPAEDEDFVRTRIRLWDLAADKERFLLPGHSQEVKDFSFAPDGATLISVGREKDRNESDFKHWDVKTGELIKTIPFAKSAWSAAFSPAGDKVAVGLLFEFDSGLRILEVATGKEIAALPVKQGSRLAYSPNGKLLVSEAPNPADLNNLVLTVWETNGWKKVKEWDGLNQMERMVFSPDGWTLLVAGTPKGGDFSKDRALYLWDLTGDEPPRARVIADLTSGAYSPDGKFVAWTTSKGELFFADPLLQKDEYKANDKFGHPLFSPGGLLLAIHGFDAGVYSVSDLLNPPKKEVP